MLKKVIFGFILVWLLLPFILMTDFYPFFRMGMFAEPIKNNIQTEKFYVILSIQGKRSLLSSRKVGFDEGHFNYLIRFAVYQKKINLFLNQIDDLISPQYSHQIDSIFLYQEIFDKNKQIFEKKEIGSKIMKK
jgi:hypothetical protein